MPILLLNASLSSYLLTLAWIIPFFLQPFSVLSEKKEALQLISFPPSVYITALAQPPCS